MQGFSLLIFAMNVVDVCLLYEGITTTSDTQDDFHNYLAEEMIDNTYDRFMMRSAEGRRRAISDSDDETVNDDNPLFGRVNGSPRCEIALYVATTKKRKKKRYGTDTQYLLQGKCKV